MQKAIYFLFSRANPSFFVPGAVAESASAAIATDRAREERDFLERPRPLHGKRKAIRFGAQHCAVQR